MGSFSLWHLLIILCLLCPVVFLIVVVAKSGRNRNYTEKPLLRLSVWLRGIIGLATFLSVCGFSLYLIEYKVLSDTATLSQDELVRSLQENTDHQKLLAIGLIFAYITGTVLGLCWIYRASCNLWAWKTPGLSFSPGGAIGFYYVPVCNLILPYQAMKEIWIKSAERAGRSGGSSILGWWWFFSIAFWIASSVKDYFSEGIEGTDQLIPAVLAGQMTWLLAIALNLTFFVIVKRVTQFQSEAAIHSSSR